MSAGAGLAQALRLVVILDKDAARGRDPADLAAAAVRGGATMLQLRDKMSSAAELAAAARRILGAAGAVPLIVNDRLDVALATGAAGCHLGQDDFPIADAKALIPAGFILGGSAGNEEEARRATQAGAHYLGVGPVRATGNKADAGDAIGVDGFTRVALATGLPCVAVGGIGPADVLGLMEAGAAGVAVIGAALATDDVEGATRRLREAFA